ncbi:MAG TPA: hypothetical protein VFA81_06090 [Burkholderiales bacterium]|nr:hypothetical protein [Burkholderiales bacterium]
MRLSFAAATRCLGIASIENPLRLTMTLNYPAALGLTCLVLAACAGGGGGGGGSSPPPTYTPLTGNTTALLGQSSNYDVDLLTGQLTSRSGTVQGNATLTAAGVPVSGTLNVSTTSVSFTDTFSFSGVTPGTVNGATTGTATAQLYTQTKTATDSSQRQLTILDPASVGLSYSSFGQWAYAPPSATSFSGGNFVMGFPTRAGDLPNDTTATYQGIMIGTYANGANIYSVGATANATANFGHGAGSIVLTTTGTQITPLFGVPTPAARSDLNLSGTLTYAATNNLSGTLSTGSGMTGLSAARFFGPAAVELGGTLFVNKTGEQMSGGYVLRKQ